MFDESHFFISDTKSISENLKLKIIFKKLKL